MNTMNSFFSQLKKETQKIRLAAPERERMRLALDAAMASSAPSSLSLLRCAVISTTIESLSGPPDMSVPAARAVKEISVLGVRFFSFTNFTSSQISSASTGRTTAFGTTLKRLASREFLSNTARESSTSPRTTLRKSSAKDMRQL